MCTYLLTVYRVRVIGGNFESFQDVPFHNFTIERKSVSLYAAQFYLWVIVCQNIKCQGYLVAGVWEEIGHGLFQSASLPFTWRDWIKLWRNLSQVIPVSDSNRTPSKHKLDTLLLYQTVQWDSIRKCKLSIIV